jgi:hypothetical protein
MGNRGNKGYNTKQTNSPTSATSARVAIENREKVVTDYIKAYLCGRERWLKALLIIYGLLIFVLVVWFTIISGQLIEWNNYKARAIKVLDNSERALEDWRRATGLTDTTETYNGTGKKR